MEDIIARQNAAAKPATGKAFLLGIARIILELAIAQLIVNFLITATGVGLLNLLFYAFAIVLLVRFMTGTVAGCMYMLRRDTLVLQRLLGDSTVLGVEIPLESIVSIRPYAFGERLALDYRQVTYVDMTCAPGLRMRVAFAVSLVCAGLARLIAGKKARREAGALIVYMEGKKRSVCAFKPDAAFLAALEAALPDAFGVDERLAREPLETYAAKSLRRAFGDLYPHVPDAITEEELAYEREEFARRREEKIEARAKKKNMTAQEYKAQMKKRQRKQAAFAKKCTEALSRFAGFFAFLRPAKETAEGIARDFAQEEPKDEPHEAAHQESPRRRRGRQE